MDGYEKTLTGRDAEKFGQQFLETLPVGAKIKALR